MAAIEKYYTAKELVPLLSWTRQRISRHFKHHPLTVRDGRRFFVPHSVVEQTLLRMRNSTPKPVRRGPPRKLIL